MFNKLFFGPVDSSFYGAYISGTGVFNAPERAVELVSVPGRNGAVAIDQGRWENIEVEYPGGMFGANRFNFSRKLMEFRNALKSQTGYQRLQDSYHPEEYRLGMFIDTFETDPVQMTRAGEFSLRFNCKPQRFLTSGESEISVTSGDEIYNPTPYDAQPMIEVTGYGTLTVGDKEIEIANATMGDITLIKNASKTFANTVKTDSCSYTETLGAAAVSENGDTITVKTWMSYSVGYASVSSILQSSSVTTQPTYGTATVSGDIGNNHRAILKITGVELPFVKGTSSSYTLTAVYSVDYKRLNLATTRNAAITVNLVVSYDAANDTIDLTTNYSYTAYDASDFLLSDRYIAIQSAVVESTQSILGAPTYIDCDLGECYKIENGTVVDLNGYIDLGSDLPALKPGTNEITYDNTVMDLKVVPRWWIL